MSPEVIKELREKFFKECRWTFERPITTEQTFQWIVDNVIKAKEEENNSSCTCFKNHGVDNMNRCNNCGGTTY